MNEPPILDEGGSDSLVGLWVHILSTKDEVLYQGQIVRDFGTSVLVQHYSWMTTEATNCLIWQHPTQSPDRWSFYANSEAMVATYDRNLLRYDRGDMQAGACYLRRSVSAALVEAEEEAEAEAKPKSFTLLRASELPEEEEGEKEH